MATPDLDFRSTNALWASVMVETLVRAGVRRAVVSPGSRSTPLTIALARHRGIEAVPVLDERSAGFFALGLAKVELEPVLLVCTSGTAAANYFPAIVEARESAVPLLVITADRPPEMRACASGQTIDQQQLYGTYAAFFHETAVPELEVAQFRYLRQTIAHAVGRTRLPQGGVVHLNVPFRDPLPPLDDGGKARTFGGTIDWAHFFEQIRPPMWTSAMSVPPLLAPDVHGVIVVGPSQPAPVDEFVTAVETLAGKLGWPVIADGLTPLRSRASQVPRMITTYDTILRHPATAERLRPDVVLCVGGWPTSKVLRSWLEQLDAPMWLVSERADNRDALHGRTRQISMGLLALAAAVPAANAPSGYAEMWVRYEQRIRTALDERMRATSDLFEMKAAWLLAQHLPSDTPLVIGNSMPIRDVEYVWPPGERRIRPFCNRGANGIDGTLSTALGVAHASGRQTVLLTGDLALLHDTNGFLIAPKLRGALTIVLVNNAGGGIFEHLPVARFDPPFEEFFATPQTADFGRLASAYGVHHEVVRDWAHLVELVSTLPGEGVRVLELRTDRKRDTAQRKRWFAELSALLG